MKKKKLYSIWSLANKAVIGANSFDFRDIVMHECVCGSNLWKLIVTFEDSEISFYMLEMQCAVCGTLAKAPTPVDKDSYDI